MWFRNVRFYTLAEDFALPQSLEEALETHRFRPCERQQRSSLGWSSPFGREHTLLHHSIGSSYLLCARKEEKVLPSAVITAQLEERLQLREQETGRAVVGKEKQTMKEELIAQLLPQAFSKFRQQWAMIDMQLRVIAIDASSATAAEELLALLRSSCGSLPVKPWQASAPAELHFTTWLQQQRLPEPFRFGDEIELRDPADQGAVVRCKQLALLGSEISEHLAQHKQATKIGLEFAERLTFVLDQDCAIKRLKPTDLLLEQTDKIVDGATAEQKLDADFALLSAELRQLFPALVDLMQQPMGVE